MRVAETADLFQYIIAVIDKKYAFAFIAAPSSQSIRTVHRGTKTTKRFLISRKYQEHEKSLHLLSDILHFNRETDVAESLNFSFLSFLLLFLPVLYHSSEVVDRDILYAVNKCTNVPRHFFPSSSDSHTYTSCHAQHVS